MKGRSVTGFVRLNSQAGQRSYRSNIVNSKDMPTLEECRPIYSAISLQDKQARHMRAWAFFRAEYQGQAAVKLKRLAEGLARDFKSKRNASDRCKIAASLVSVIEQQRILYRIPAPGRDGPKEERTLEMSAAEVVELASEANVAQMPSAMPGAAGVPSHPGPASPDASQPVSPPPGGWPDLMA